MYMYIYTMYIINNHIIQSYLITCIYIHTLYIIYCIIHIYIYISVYNSLIHIYTVALPSICHAYNRILGPSGDFADPLVAKIHRAEGITSSDQPGITNFGNADLMWPFQFGSTFCWSHLQSATAKNLDVSLLKSPKSAAHLANCLFWLTRETSHGQLGTATGGRRAQLVFQQLHGDLTSGDWRNGLDVFIKWI